MKNQPLKPWIKGNESITPNNSFSNALPNLEYGAWISLDIAVELYKANTIDTGYLKKSWNEHHEYIEQVCLLTGIDEENGYDLDREEKWWVLQEIGEPPFGCYNIYFITIYNEHEEKLVYIGKTDSKKSRFSNGHLAALKLHNPIYNGYNKRVYFGTVMFLSDDKEYVPLEFISPYSRAERYLSEIGHRYVPEVEVTDLSNIILETIASLNEINPLTGRLIQIARDGKISDDEMKDFAYISKKLDEISLAIDSLNLWVDKTAGEQGLNLELLNAEKEKLK